VFARSFETVDSREKNVLPSLIEKGERKEKVVILFPSQRKKKDGGVTFSVLWKDSKEHRCCPLSFKKKKKKRRNDCTSEFAGGNLKSRSSSVKKNRLVFDQRSGLGGRE